MNNKTVEIWEVRGDSRQKLKDSEIIDRGHSFIH